jgi:glycine zipper-containing protein DUF883
MADAKARSADLPNFDTYPATPPAGRQLPREGVTDTPLAQSAEQLGSTLGRAVNLVRDLPGRILSMKDRVGSRDLSATAEEWKTNAQRRVADAQQRARRIVRENPLQALAVVAGVAFLLGVAIRIWRSDRD